MDALQCELAAIKDNLPGDVSDQDLVRYLDEERKYLANLKQGSPDISLKASYVQALNELAKCR